MQRAFPRRVFVSYSSEDRNFVSWLVERLNTSGVDVWYDQWEIAVGDSIVTRINIGLHQSDWLAVVLSPASVKSAWVSVELDAAMIANIKKRQAKLLPILYRDCIVPPLLRRLKFADCRYDREEGIRALLDAIEPERDLRAALERGYRSVARYIRALDTSKSKDVMATAAARIDGGLVRLVDLRYRFELKKQHRCYRRDTDLFKQIDFLEKLGINARSPTWAWVRDFRNARGHSVTPAKQLLQNWKYVADRYHELLRIAREVSRVEPETGA